MRRVLFLFTLLMSGLALLTLPAPVVAASDYPKVVHLTPSCASKVERVYAAPVVRVSRGNFFSPSELVVRESGESFSAWSARSDICITTIIYESYWSFLVFYGKVK